MVPLLVDVLLSDVTLADMTLADVTNASGPSAVDPPSRARSIDRLVKRADFVRAAKGQKFHLPVFSLQALGRDLSGVPDAAAANARIGFTVTKKVGNAVERNRVRRRLKEALRLVPVLAARSGHDYVLIARRDVLAAPFPALVADLDRSFRAIHERAGGGRRQGRPKAAHEDGRDQARGR